MAVWQPLLGLLTKYDSHVKGSIGTQDKQSTIAQRPRTKVNYMKSLWSGVELRLVLQQATPDAKAFYPGKVSDSF